ncbi:cobalamin biosynthesis protein CbiG [Catenuloplanes nepalensis]|uniref:Cobalamin biosynthesis protein CbiG n=1 Tax=Catenuloplanes nepalensis TaxID=587533 RepID=A0ABT9MWA2_9ACTN|nr:cobalamin biosynthesis protein [Catenuloplanes nepalensis]MDP9795276.1 cobalamin biosynthesis protein CbiG [Catenuloplanes nepalensis]
MTAGDALPADLADPAGTPDPDRATRSCRYAVGVGVRPQTTGDELAGLIDAVLTDREIAPGAVVALATLDRRADHPAVRAVAAARGWPVIGYSAGELGAVATEAAGSPRVQAAVGTPSVAEAAALLAAAEPGGHAAAHLIVTKRTVPTAAVAIAMPSPAAGEESEQ